MPIELQVGYDIIRSYKRLAYTPWHALAEFVDNSTQSYFNNREELDPIFAKTGDRLEVAISYDRASGTVKIRDNAMGMSYEDLQHAVHIGKPPANTAGRSQFGLGLKTAACWFGDLWRVRTKKLHEKRCHEIEIDVEKVAVGQAILPYKHSVAKASEHYTEIEICQLNTTLQGRRLGKIKEFLRSMYRVDIREGTLDLYWDGVRLEWPGDPHLLMAPDGTAYKRQISFSVNNKKVTGWVGVLGPGSSGRPNAGFTLIRRGRVIRGWPDWWRPEAVFGQMQGSNDLVNQRITGEIVLDEFEVTHTKDDILWEGEEEDSVQERIAERIRDFIEVADTYRRPTGDTRADLAAVQAGARVLRAQMSNDRIVACVSRTAEEVPPWEIVREAFQPFVIRARKGDPVLEVRLSPDVVTRLFVSEMPRPTDVYVMSDPFAERDIDVVVNANHPAFSGLVAGPEVALHLAHCLADALCAWQLARSGLSKRPEAGLLLKDGILRASKEGESDS